MMKFKELTDAELQKIVGGRAPVSKREGGCLLKFWGICK